MRSAFHVAFSAFTRGVARRLALAVSAQTGSTTTPAATSSPAAYVYVQTSSGVVGYSAASNGALTKLPGSPFKTSGLLAGSTGYAFYSVGTDWIHSHSLASNGAIGAQVSQINTQNYSGADCGQALAGAAGVLDHSGKYFYNLLNNYGDCAAYQTYSVGQNGVLTFNNWTQVVQDAWRQYDHPYDFGERIVRLCNQLLRTPGKFHRLCA